VQVNSNISVSTDIFTFMLPYGPAFLFTRSIHLACTSAKKSLPANLISLRANRLPGDLKPDQTNYIRESLINSESFICAGKMCQIKAPIAGNSKAIAKIGNAELAHFTKQMLIHELIRDSLGANRSKLTGKDDD